jgi:copper(I)-binding protein
VKTVRAKSSCILSVGILLVACEREPDNAGLGFDQAWVRAVPAGVNMTAGFGTLLNPGQETVQLNDFSSPSFGEVSLHRTETAAGVSRMREVAALTIDAGSSVTLEPGGYHLMLIAPNKEIQLGEYIAIEMHTQDGRSFRFDVPVMRR